MRTEIQRTRESRLIPIPALSVTATTSGAAQTLHTLAAHGLQTIDSMHVRNTTGTAATLTFHAIPSGDSIGDANELLPLYNVPANTALRIDGLLGKAFAASTALKVFSGTNGALLVWGTLEQWT